MKDLQHVLAKGMLESAHVHVTMPSHASHRLRLPSEEHPGDIMIVGLACAQGYEVGCAGDSTLLGSCVCPAFPPGIWMEVLVEAGSPGKCSQQSLRSRAELGRADSCPTLPDGTLLPELWKRYL